MAKHEWQLSFKVDDAQLRKVSDEVISAVLLAGTRTIRTATRNLEKELEAATRAAVPGKLYRAWKSEVYPRQDRGSYNPAGRVFANGGSRTKGALAYWTSPGVNRSAAGYWRAIPTKAAGATTRDRNLTPAAWERRTGIKLEFVFLRGKRVGMLVASGVEAKNKSGALRAATSRRLAQGRDVKQVAIFFLIPFQEHANQVSIAGPVRRANDYIAASFARRLARLT